MPLNIRRATPDDAALIQQLVHELAVYEKLEHEMVATPSHFVEALSGPSPKVFADIAAWEGEPVGFALWFYSFSTFLGRNGIYLEDLYVREAARGRGIGKALLQHLAQRCVDEGLGRLDWQVLDWNTPSIKFYESQGATINRTWLPVRVDGQALVDLAKA